ncbi:zinc finger protein 22-like [Macaca thibetana thibetana]|uniref:zinc finger protein 22-like n=1 Tax=Macaca thibetana thibetana TaxID=257877 RepID=UPI0021BCBAE0|nr:zinc finger protein 22-like [Macaca thibetana thibetana]
MGVLRRGCPFPIPGPARGVPALPHPPAVLVGPRPIRALQWEVLVAPRFQQENGGPWPPGAEQRSQQFLSPQASKGQRTEEKPAGRKKKMPTSREKTDAQKSMLREKASGDRKPLEMPTVPRKPRTEPRLSPEEEEHIFDAFHASFKNAFEGVPVFIPFQRKKPDECSECRQIFKHKKDHICRQRVHTRKKPFKCEQCGKAFRHSSSVTKHQRTHTVGLHQTCCLAGVLLLGPHWRGHPRCKWAGEPPEGSRGTYGLLTVLPPQSLLEAWPSWLLSGPWSR